MLIREAITYCNQMTGQVLLVEDMVRWLSELDGKLALEFYRADAWTPYDPEDDLGMELLVPFPWDGFYPHYLEAMTYYSNAEYDRYENARKFSESLLSEFRAFMQRTMAALCGEGFPTEKAGGNYVTVIPEQAENVWRWISAYGLAVKHGYKGTEEEWLASLVGSIGPVGPPGPQGEIGPEGTLRDLNSGQRVRLWFGTLEEYNALEIIYSDVYYNIKESSV